MKAYAATIFTFLTVGFTSVTAQQQLQPVPVAPPVTASEQQQVQQTDVAVQAQPAEPPQPQHIVLRVVGSQVRNQIGERLGLIEEVFVHRASGAAEYAVVSPSYPTNSSRQVPVPWGALTYVWDQSRAGGPSGANQVFILNMDARLLAQAPALDRSRLSTMDQTLANSRNFFGVPQAAGAAGTPATGVTGAAAGQTGATTTAPVTGGVVGQPIDNPVVVPGQRSTVQPGGNVAETPDQRVPHVDNAAPRAGGQSGKAPAQGTSGGTQSGGGRATGGSGGATGGGATGR